MIEICKEVSIYLDFEDILDAVDYLNENDKFTLASKLDLDTDSELLTKLSWLYKYYGQERMMEELLPCLATT